MQQMTGWFNRRSVSGLVILVLATAVPLRAASADHSPADPSFAQQWALREVSAPEAWNRAADLLGGAAPTPVVVAVIDSGVDAGHPDLAGMLRSGHSFVAGADTAGDDSPEGHGTAVAGIIAALTNNTVGIAGAAGPFPVRILPLKALAADASGDLDSVAAAIRWALAWRGEAGEQVRVINLSLGVRMATPPQSLADAVAEARTAGVLIVAAAGGDGGPVEGYYPAALPGVISVGSTRPDHTAEPTANVGALIGAPGVGILTTLPGGGYGLRSGTSFAAPFVSAAAALLWSVFPSKSRAELIYALLGGQAELPCSEPGRSSCQVLSLDLALARFATWDAPTPDLTPPGPPLHLQAAPEGGGGVWLAWNPPAADADVVGYVLLRSGATAPRRTRWLEYFEGSLTPGGTYDWDVAAIDRTGNRSAMTRVTVTLPRLSPRLR